MFGDPSIFCTERL
jgi:hypothetical protein